MDDRTRRFCKAMSIIAYLWENETKEEIEAIIIGRLTVKDALLREGIEANGDRIKLEAIDLLQDFFTNN